MTNEETYCNEMSKGVEEKLFFLDHICPNFVIDFGCADGQVTDVIHEEMGDCGMCLGYDKNLDLLPDVTGDQSKALRYFDDWDELQFHLDSYFPNGDCEVAIYLSSILHEIYSYGDFDEVFEKVFNLGPDYIIIRDMYMTDTEKKVGVTEEQINQTLNNVNLRLVSDFTNRVGPIMSQEGFIHFLMKHRFAYNWEHEIKENYLSITDERLDTWKAFGDVIFEEHEPLPYYVDVFQIRYDYELSTPTHIKLIIET